MSKKYSPLPQKDVNLNREFFDISVAINDLTDDVDSLVTTTSVTAATGAVITFTDPKIWNSPASPTTDNITDDLTGAIIGSVQKVYHNHSVAPTFPAGWVILGTGAYVTSTLNIIYCEWVSGTRVEYWITQ